MDPARRSGTIFHFPNMLKLALVFLVVARASANNCSVYSKTSDNCGSDCGSCFNPGSRSGVICKGSQTGYYCASDNPPAGADMAFACMDWTFQSEAMKNAEQAFSKRTGEHVYFGVGTYGTGSDGQRGLGSCLRMRVSGVDKDLIVQSINTGSDVAGNQFDLQIGDGGAGAFNTCAGGTEPGVSSMYPGKYDMGTWGHQYGGVDNRADCSNLPLFPAVSEAMKSAGDNLVSLCEAGFDKGVRMEGGGNPSIQQFSRVKCPEELLAFTQLQRSDDPTTYALQYDAATHADHECQASQPGGTLAYCLTRMMDCRKPSGAFKDNIQPSLVVQGRKLVQPCTSDGYTRIDVQCGCSDCYC